tara:strand:- start:1497 stop:2066 length:570 start_codon:yes stop_codon:yes gene_type:complete
MFAYKKKYFLIIESIKDFNIRNIKKPNKFAIIYRNLKKKESLVELLRFKKNCFAKRIEFYVANDFKLAVALNSGIYISAFNKSFKYNNLKRMNFKIVGSAHNIKEINQKRKQGCAYILFSKIFFVNYKPESKPLGVNKFNCIALNKQYSLIPLGGINSSNLNKLKTVASEGIAILSELKKKPAIISRLF